MGRRKKRRRSDPQSKNPNAQTPNSECTLEEVEVPSASPPKRNLAALYVSGALLAMWNIVLLLMVLFV